MTENKQTVIADIKQIFSDGDNKIVLSKNKQVILVLGNSGAGKSTFAQLLAGDNDKLIAREKGKDSGDYWIYDENNKISKDDTILSKTIFPELLVDSTNNNAFYDCPGFNDNRNSSIDIGNTYFISKVINHADAVKIILLVNYDSLRQGENRIDFSTMLTHSTNLIKNIDKYKQSILLVASKVDNESVFNELINDYENIKDDEIVTGIATFLQNAKTSFKQKVTDSKSDKEKKTNENIVKLIDVFLQKQGTSYTNIGLFRKSNEEGRVSKIRLLQDNKETLNKLINNNLKYTRTSDSDFGYTISPTSQMFITDIIDYINKELSQTVAGIGKEITTFYRNKEKNIRDIYNLKQQLSSAYTQFSKIINKIQKEENPKHIIEYMKKGLEEWNIELTKNDYYKNIINQYGQLEFLQKLNGKKSISTKQQILTPIQEAFAEIEQSANWYVFFTNFYEKLFSYEAQQYPRKYDKFVETVNEWKRKKSKVFGFNMKEDIKEIVTRVSGFYSIERSKMDELKLGVLSDLVDSALKNNVNITCAGNRLEVRGTWIKTSDLKNDEYYYYNNKCKQFVESVEVFALKGFVVDTDYDLRNQKIQLTVIAPTWHIMRESEINLSGRNGYQQKKAGPNPTYRGTNGLTGNPGRHGTSGGTVFGVGKKFISGSRLTVLTNGGNGGDGQEGSDGAPGRDGWHNSCKWYKGDFNTGLRCTITNPKDGYVVPGSWSRSYGIQYKMEGEPGGMGGRGGDGGAYGFSGPSGPIQISQLTGSSNIKTESNWGYWGSNGKGGKPGPPGKQGNAIVAYYYSTWPYEYWTEIYAVPPGKLFPVPPNKNGEDGKGVYRRGKQHSEVEEIDKNAMLDKYKKYIKNNFNDRFNMKAYPQFYKEIDKFSKKQHSEINTDQIRERRDILSNNSVPIPVESQDLYYPNSINNEEQLNNDWENTTNLKSTGFTLNNTLLLVDFVIRKLTGSKPVNNISYDRKGKSLDILAESLNMVEKFENLLTKFLKSEGIPSNYIKTDFSNLIGKIQNELSNEYNIEKISKILYDSVPINELYKSEISNKFKKLIKNMLKENGERKFNSKMMKTKNQFHDFYITNIESNNNSQLLDQHSLPLIN